MPKGTGVDQKVKAYMKEHRVEYSEALQEVLAENPDLAKDYVRTPGEVRKEPVIDCAKSRAAGEELDVKVTQYCLDHPHVSYRDALLFILWANPGLSKEYIQR